MQAKRMLTAIATTLVLLAGHASAEQRYFEFTGTVTETRDAALAPIGSQVRGTFNYDDAMVGDYLGDYRASYDVDSELAGTIDGNLFVTDRTLVTLYDYADSAGDLFDLYSTPGLMIERDFHPDAYFGFRLLGSGLDGLNLPGALDLSRFHYAFGEVFLDGNGSLLAAFSVDSIINVSPPCLKKNGKPDKHCKHKSR